MVEQDIMLIPSIREIMSPSNIVQIQQGSKKASEPGADINKTL